MSRALSAEDRHGALEITGGFCRSCRPGKPYAGAASAEELPEEPKIHPSALALAPADWLWAQAGDYAPMGNDTGADTRAAFVEWRSRNPQSSPLRFLSTLLAGWGVEDRNWSERDEAQLRKELPSAHFHVITRDDAVIGLAFAQLALEGRVDTEVLRRAKVALRREALPAVVQFRGWTDPSERKEKLAEMHRILSAVTE